MTIDEYTAAMWHIGQALAVTVAVIGLIIIPILIFIFIVNIVKEL